MNMKRNIKVITWVIVAIILLSGCVFGRFLIKNFLYEKLNPPFEETTIFPDDSRENPADTTFTVNGIEIKMIGVRGARLTARD